MKTFFRSSSMFETLLQEKACVLFACSLPSFFLRAVQHLFYILQMTFLEFLNFLFPSLHPLLSLNNRIMRYIPGEFLTQCVFEKARKAQRRDLSKHYSHYWQKKTAPARFLFSHFLAGPCSN